MDAVVDDDTAPDCPAAQHRCELCDFDRQSDACGSLVSVRRTLAVPDIHTNPSSSDNLYSGDQRKQLVNKIPIR